MEGFCTQNAGFTVLNKKIQKNFGDPASSN